MLLELRGRIKGKGGGRKGGWRGNLCEHFKRLFPGQSETLLVGLIVSKQTLAKKLLFDILLVVVQLQLWAKIT